MKNDKNFLCILWYIHKKCNLSCKYCFQNDIEEVKEVLPTKEQIDDIVNTFISTNRNIKIYLSGGEITLYENINYVLAKLNSADNVKVISLISNCTKDVEFFKDILSYDKVQLNYSIHLEHFFKNKPKQSLLLESFKGKNVVLTLMLDKENFYTGIELIEFLKQFNLKIKIKLIRDQLSDMPFSDYTDAEMQIFKITCTTLGMERTSDVYIPIVYKYCTTGNYINIDFDGRCYSSAYRCKELAPTIFNMYRNPKHIAIALNPTVFRCSKNTCYGANNCDRFIYKTNNKKDALRFIV